MEACRYQEEQRTDGALLQQVLRHPFDGPVLLYGVLWETAVNGLELLLACEYETFINRCYGGYHIDRKAERLY